MAQHHEQAATGSMPARPIAAGPRPIVTQAERPAPPVQAQPAGAEAKRPTLFERMIGPRQANEPVERPQPAARPVTQTIPTQNNLGIDGPRQAAMKSEDEILDIPAFLRRQAN